MECEFFTLFRGATHHKILVDILSLVFFLHDVWRLPNCQLAKAVCDDLMISKWICICIFVNIFMNDTPKIQRSFTYEPVLQSSNHHIETFAKLAKYLEKPLVF